MSQPVFVDPTGRRLSMLRMAGRVAGAALAGYLVLVVASLAAPPGLDRLQVPGVGDVVPGQRAPEVVTSDGDEVGASDAVEDARRTGAAPVTGPATDKPATGPSRGGATPAPSPSRGPTATPVKGKPTAPPGQSNASPRPKATSKPTSKPKPTPSNKPGTGRGNGLPAGVANPVGSR